MEGYIKEAGYRADMEPSFRRHWSFFVLGWVIYGFAVLTALWRPVSCEGIDTKLLLCAGEFLIRGTAYLLFGIVALLLGRVPLMLPLWLWEGLGFRLGLRPMEALYNSGQYARMCLLLLLRVGFVYISCLRASIVCWEETKAVFRKRRRLLLPIRIRRETLVLLAAASFLAAWMETWIL